VGYFWTIVALIVALGITWRYLGSYMAAVFDGRVHFLGWVERPIYRAPADGDSARGSGPPAPQPGQALSLISNRQTLIRHREREAYEAPCNPVPQTPSGTGSTLG